MQRRMKRTRSSKQYGKRESGLECIVKGDFLISSLVFATIYKIEQLA